MVVSSSSKSRPLRGKYFDCKECGNRYYREPYRVASNTGFCSQKCRSSNGLETRECVVCGTSVSKRSWAFHLPVERTTCSKSCASKLGHSENLYPKRFERIVVSGYWALTKMHDHPLSNKNGLVLEHRKVLYDEIGPGPHECHWGCGRVLVWGGKTLEEGLCVDHLNGNRRENDPDNLVPSCRSCNSLRAMSGNQIDWVRVQEQQL